MNPDITGVIVAAGASSRMGQSKPLVVVAGRPMLQWVVDAAEASMLGRVVVVTGPGDAAIRSRIAVSRAYFVHNPAPERGTMSSLREGVLAGSPADAVMKLVADQPEVTADDIDAVIGAWNRERPSCALASYTDSPGHPLLVARDLLDTVLWDDGNRLLWDLIEGEGDGALRVPVARSRPIDVNAPEDVARAVERLN